MAGNGITQTPLNTGLTDAQVRQRVELGYVNRVVDATDKSTGRIIKENICTLFNLLNVALAVWVVTAGSYKNMLFMGVVVLNTVIDIVQELRARAALKKLSLISAPTVIVRRDGKEQKIALHELVKDDVMLLSGGMQICADGVVLNGYLEVDESLLTGEADTVQKRAGDKTLSGSFVVSGRAAVQAVTVGEESFAAKLASEARKLQKPNSELMKALNRILRFVSALILPIGALIFCKQYFLTGDPYAASVVSAVAAMIGMIPEGLVLLTSVALAVGVIRLSRQQTLVRSLYCLETLARVDVLCLDKTGTITSGDIAYENMELLEGDESEVRRAIRLLLGALGAENATGKALQSAFGSECAPCQRTLPFSSARKYSAVEEGGFTYALGAAQFVMPGADADLMKRASVHAGNGRRVLLLARGEGALGERGELPAAIAPLAFVLLTDVIRPEAPSTMRFFADQGVNIKVISGDDARTVSAIAARAGLNGADRYVDMTGVSDDDEIARAASAFTVFGRVLPEQKKKLVLALKAAGHTVAMTGDGVNDVPALKQADCSVAMASGSDAARQVANIVLMDCNFASMPEVVMEGRRVINNIRRSASLFLTKTIFSFIAAVLTIAVGRGYPLMPIQLTLFSSVAIGLPSFLLALEPNRARVQGDFLRTVIRNALPGALALAGGVILIGRLAPAGLSGTMSTYFMLAVGLFGVLRVCMPLSARRAAILLVCVALAAANVLLLPGIYGLMPLAKSEWQTVLLCSAAMMGALSLLAWGIDRRYPSKIT